MTEQLYANPALSEANVTIVGWHEQLTISVEQYVALDEAMDDLVSRHKENKSPVAPDLIEDIAMLEDFYQARLRYKADKQAIDASHQALLEELKTVEGEIVQLLEELELVNIWIKVQVASRLGAYGVRYCYSSWGGRHTVVEVRPWIEPMPGPYRDPVD